MKPKFREWTQEQVQQDFNYFEGFLYWKTGPMKGKLAGWVDKFGYTNVRYKNVLVKSHNLIWLHQYGSWPDFEVDHVDNDPTNNKLKNLRPSSRKENCSNQRLQNRREGKFKGVHKTTGYDAFYVKIKKDGKQYYGGSYMSELEAALAYNIKAEKLFGKFAKFNKVFEDHPDAEKEFVV